MKLVLVLIALLAVPALADGNGTDILPWSTPGGEISGTVTVDSNGDATVQGIIQGVPFTCLGKVPWTPNGWNWDILLSDADQLLRQKSWIPLKFHFWGTKEDAEDGDDLDDSVGSIDVKSQMGAGKGSVQLGG